MKIPATTSAFPYFPVCVLHARGADAQAFLQSQFTNDLGKMTTGGSVYGLWLDRKGRVLADSWVIRGKEKDEFLVVSLNSAAPVIAGHLEAHIIADEVEIADETGAWRGVALVGPGSGDALASVARPGFTFPGRRSAGENHEWILPAGEWAEAEATIAGLPAPGPQALELLRIRAAIPRIPADIGPSDLPNEGGLDRDAISYSKGCYTGQEVMARVKALGRVRRRLVLVGGEGDAPAVPAALWSGEARAGEIRSVAPAGGGFEGLALVPAAAQGPFSLEPGAKPRVAIRGN